MPGDDESEELSFREAREEGRIGEYREQQAEKRQDQEYKDSQTQRTEQAAPGDLLATKRVHEHGSLASVTVHILGPVPNVFEARVILTRGTSQFEDRHQVDNGENRFTSLNFGQDLHEGDVISVNLTSNDPEETDSIGPIVASITTAHA